MSAKQREYSTADIPGLLLDLLGESASRPWLSAASAARSVVFLWLDGLSWNAATSDPHERLRRLFDDGLLVPARAAFPTTTTAHEVTFATGLSVEEHGLYEWFTFDPVEDDVVAALRFERADGSPLVRLHSPEEFLPAERTATLVEAIGAQTTVVCSRSVWPTRAAAWAPARVISEPEPGRFVDRVVEFAANATRSLVVAHWTHLDTAGHEHGLGPGYRRARDTALDCAIAIVDRLRGRDVAFVVGADHGMEAIDERIALQTHVAELAAYLRRNAAGMTYCSGGARDCFLHPLEGCRTTVLELLTEALDGLAVVSPARELFDARAGERLLSRVGDAVVVLPRPGHAVWLRPAPTLEFNGMHGGFGESEALVPLGVQWL